MTVNIIHGSYWADDIVNELVSMYFMEALRAQTATDYGIGRKWEGLQGVLRKVAVLEVPMVAARPGRVVLL